MHDIERIRFGQFGSSIGPKELARTVREKVETLLKNKKRVLFDFHGVHIISSAFAFELFGILFQELGGHAFENLRINGFDSEEDKKVILAIIAKTLDAARAKSTSAGRGDIP